MRAALLLGILALGAQHARAQTSPEQPSAIASGESSPATCDVREAEELRAHLTHQARRASTWNFAWKWTFTAAAVGSTAVALADPFPELRDGLYVSGGKAAIAALGRWILPLKIDVPPPSPDPCTDLARLREVLAKAAKHQHALFFTNHVGGLAVNLAGASILWYRGSPGQALLSIATGYPVGLLSTYTMPRGSWHRHRDRTWTATVFPHEHGWLVAIAGAF